MSKKMAVAWVLVAGYAVLAPRVSEFNAEGGLYGFGLPEPLPWVEIALQIIVVFGPLVYKWFPQLGGYVDSASGVLETIKTLTAAIEELLAELRKQRPVEPVQPVPPVTPPPEPQP